METLQSFLFELRQAIEAAKSSLVIYGVLFGLLAAGLSILLIWLGRRFSLFQRSTKTWRFIARVNYNVLLPLLLTGMGVSLGMVFGAKSATDNFIAQQTSDISQYAHEYVASFQKYARGSLGSTEDKKMSVNEAVARHLSTDVGVEPGSAYERAVYELNLASIQQGLKSIMRSGVQKDSLEALRKADLAKMSANSFASVPRMLHLRSSIFYFDYYTNIIWVFGLLLLIPLSEFLIYQLYRQFGSKAQMRPVVMQRAFQTLQEPANESTFQVPPEGKFVSAPPPPQVIPDPPIAVRENVAPPPPAETVESHDLTPEEQPELAAPPPVALAEPVPAPKNSQQIPEINIDKPAMEDIPGSATSETATIPPSKNLSPEQAVVEPQTASSIPAPNIPQLQALSAADNGQRIAIRAVTFILCGALLQVMYGVTDDFSAELVALIGLGLYFIGLGWLESILDYTGKNGIGMLKIGTIVGIVGGIIGLIPAVGGLLSVLPSVAAFILQLLGLLRLKNSSSFGPVAQNGFTMQLIGLGLAIPAAIISAFPFGDILGGFIYIVVLLLFLYGWLEVQKELLSDPHLKGIESKVLLTPVQTFTSKSEQPTSTTTTTKQEPTLTAPEAVAFDTQNVMNKLSSFDIKKTGAKRPVVPALFGLTMLFFFFTFCEFSCQGARLAQVSGIELVTGTTIEPPKDLGDTPMGDGIFGPSKNEESEPKALEPNLWAVLAFTAALAGLIIFLIGNRLENLIGMAAGGIGAASLLILKTMVQNAVLKETKGFIQVDFTFGYWLAVLSLIIAGVLCFLRWQELNKPPTN